MHFNKETSLLIDYILIYLDLFNIFMLYVLTKDQSYHKKIKIKHVDESKYLHE